MGKLNLDGTEIQVLQIEEDDYISLTDMADAIKVNLIPPELTPQQTSVIYASEADVLNMALFGMTAKQWWDKNPDKYIRCLFWKNRLQRF